MKMYVRIEAFSAIADCLLGFSLITYAFKYSQLHLLHQPVFIFEVIAWMLGMSVVLELDIVRDC